VSVDNKELSVSKNSALMLGSDALGNEVLKISGEVEYLGVKISGKDSYLFIDSESRPESRNYIQLDETKKSIIIKADDSAVKISQNSLFNTGFHRRRK
jgi:hypothetical protein